MRWEDFRRSDNVDDLRGGGGGSRGGGPVVRTGGLGLGGMVVLGLIGWFLGIDPRVLIGGAELITGGGQPQIEQTRAPSRPGQQPQDQLGQFASAVLAQTEDTWTELFRGAGQTYEKPRLVLFQRQVQSACGFAQSAQGPFYCPADKRVYLDLSFFEELKTRFRAPGDFAAAYVIAHEVGHHIQNLMGILPRVQQAQRRMSEAEANGLQVRVELQADCFAGVWAHHADRRFRILEQGDVEEALGAAAAIGDDRLQKQAQGYVIPDSFTHGTSDQRRRWFTTGLRSGSMQSCDTFQARQL